ncbi:MAG: signal peptidase II [Rickettsiales bacterium]|jgi:signal peptidase II|nr:signal peptidase II [Rickettsiales bacterium]
MKKIISIVLGAVVVDQITKGILLSMVAGGWKWAGDAFALVPHPYFIARVFSWFNIVFTWNPGSSFSMFREAPAVIMIGLTGAVIGYLAWLLFTKTRDIPMALIVGGALGNLIDRVRFGAVVDFIDWHAGTWHWPAFNIADVCICVGVGLYLLQWIKRKK